MESICRIILWIQCVCVCVCVRACVRAYIDTRCVVLLQF